MKRNCLVLFISFMLLLSASVFASGDVTVKFNMQYPLSLQNKVYVGQENPFELWVTNTGPILGTTLGFQFTASPALAFTWKTPFGNKPNSGAKYVQEYGDALGAFDVGGLKFTASALPGSWMIGGAAQDVPLPAHATSTLCWSLVLIMPADPSLDACPPVGTSTGTFTVNNIFFPPAGPWKFDEGSGNAYAPTFNGGANTSPQVPDAPDVVFCLGKIPCVPPVFTSTPGPAVSKNHCSAYTFTFAATEGGNTPAANPVTFTASAGTMNATSGELSVPASAQCGTTDVVVTATNGCGGTQAFPFTITWTNNNPVIANCPTTLQQVGMGNTFDYTLNATDPDPCDNLTWSVVQSAGPAPAGTSSFGISGLGKFSFVTTAPDDGNKTFEFTATAHDPCGATVSCTFSVFVMEVQPFIVQIEKTHNSLQGQYEWVSITKVKGSERMGGFDFLVAYDASGLTFYSAELGAAAKACGWEYFTYRFGAQGNCGGPCPSGFLRVVAIADQNNGAAHPSCYKIPDGGELVSLKFYVTNDRTFECQKVDIRFAWMDCGDNGISSQTGDTLFISKEVRDYLWTGELGDPNYNITGSDCGSAVHFGGYCDQACLVGMKVFPLEFIYFWNGGVDIVCAGDIDARGDINLNGIMNEIADAVLYTNYFLYGASALPADDYSVTPPVLARQASIAASDVNNDGRPLTVGDLVYLLRIIVGDALPYPKLAPFATSATVNFANGAVSTEAGSELGAVYATFAVNGSYNVVSNTNMKVDYAENNGELKVLVYSGTENMTNRLAAGSNDLFTVSGNVELKGVEVADYNGNMLNTRVNKTALPTSFALSQNVPNPFNPTTKIGLSLPTQSDWTLNIYNVAGQLVKSFNGNGVGNVSVEWDASMVPSGVYFYKLNAGSYTDTKKMVLMK